MTSAHLGDKRSQVNCYSSRYHPALASPSHNQGSALDRSINLFLQSYTSLPYLPFFAPNRTLPWCLIRIERREKELSPLLGLLIDFSHSFFPHSLIPPFHLATSVLHVNYSRLPHSHLCHCHCIAQCTICIPIPHCPRPIKYVQVLILGLACFNTHFCVFSSLFS